MNPQTVQRVHNALALYELTVSNGEFVVTSASSDLPFELSQYSEFKYGRRDCANKYGLAIAEMLIAHFAEDSDDPIVVIGTPYKRVPNAARMLAITAERYMRAAGLPTSYSYIYQHRLASGDYSALPAHIRDQRNKQKKRFVDPDDFTGKRVVVIDDIRITGSIERSILALLDDIAVLSTTIVNLVKLDPDVALAEPHLEEKLNHHAVTCLSDLRLLMRRPDRFVLTTRAVKYILQSNHVDLGLFLGHLSSQQILELYEAVIDEGYDQMPQYEESFRLVQDACQFSSSHYDTESRRP